MVRTESAWAKAGLVSGPLAMTRGMSPPGISRISWRMMRIPGTASSSAVMLAANCSRSTERLLPAGTLAFSAWRRKKESSIFSSRFNSPEADVVSSGAQGIRANHFGQGSAAVGRGHYLRPHLIEVDGHAVLGYLVGGFDSGQPAADDRDCFFHPFRMNLHSG